MTSVMIVEDEFIVAQDLATKLKNMGYSVYGSYESGESALQETHLKRPDLVMMDINLKGGMDGIQTARKMNTQFKIPIIFLTAFANQALIERAKSTEPMGYLIKPFTEKELQTTIEIGLYKAEIEKKLRASEKRFRDMADLLPSVICEVDPAQRITFINRAGLKILKLSDNDVAKGMHIGDFLPSSEQEKAQDRFAQVLNGKILGSMEYQLVDKEGEQHTFIINSAPIHGGDTITGIRTSLVDITQLKQLQLQLKQAWKMDAVETLAGGIAHEFNNSLACIVGCVEIMQSLVSNDSSVATCANDIMASVNRMAGLTSQMLAYARGGNYRTRLASLNALVQKAFDTVRQSIPPAIRVTTQLQDNVVRVKMDDGQFQFILASLVTNAYEAMETSGQIRIITKNINVDEILADQHAGLKSGSYACLQVEDDGPGMDGKTRQKIFEPFFSTKFPGRGMGMAAIYGIIKNHGGWIGIESNLGSGTRVSIYFPEIKS